MNDGEALVATLLAHGVRAGFAVPGESYLAVLEALRHVQDRFQLITCRHEGGAGFAAEAYGKLTRNPGVAFVTRGPGATNAAIGVHTAAQDSSPMVLFIGQIPSTHKGREAFQEIDYQAMFGIIAKAVIEPTGPDDVARATAEALDTARVGRPGPVVVPLPEDVTENDFLGDPGRANLENRPKFRNFVKKMPSADQTSHMTSPASQQTRPGNKANSVSHLAKPSNASFSNNMRLCSTSYPGENQVDGLPPALHILEPKSNQKLEHIWDRKGNA